MKIVKNIIESWKAPTPLKWRMYGTACLTACTFIGSFVAFQNIKWLVIVSFILGLIGKEITNLVTEDVTPATPVVPQV